MDFYDWGIVNLFSSPYGDCTEAWHDSYKAILLSPLYGDGARII